jgi:hypothetical protein
MRFGGEREWNCMQDWKAINNMEKTINFQIFINSIDKLYSVRTVDMHWHKQDVTIHIQRNVSETQQINYYCISPLLGLTLQHRPKSATIHNRLRLNSTSLHIKVHHKSWRDRLQRMDKYCMLKAAFQCQNLERQEMGRTRRRRKGQKHLNSTVTNLLGPTLIKFMIIIMLTVSIIFLSRDIKFEV